MPPDAPGRRGPPRSGCVEPLRRADGTIYFRARIRVADGTRVRVDVPERYSVAAGGKTARERAELYAEALQEREDETGELLAQRNAGQLGKQRPPSATGATVREWYMRYYEAAERGTVGRKNRGRPQSSAGDRRARFRTWIDPVIGSLAMTAVTSADLRRVVQRLDAAVRERAAFYEKGGAEHEGKKPGLSSKTAQNVWSEITNGFREARKSKIDDLAILRGRPDPTADVEPPTTGEEREQAALFPSEILQLLTCEAIPLARRRLYAVGIYTGMRRSEIERLEAADVDLEHDVIRVRGKKTNAARRTIPIEPALRPLLVALVRERPTGALLDVPRSDGKGGSSDLVKRDLERAGLVRVDLTRDDAEHMPFTFHGLRHTCITHWVVGGRDQLFLLTAGGHTDVEMTRRYLAAASSLSTKFGQPHPPLPECLWSENRAEEAGAQKQSGEPRRIRRNSHVAFATPAGIEGKQTAEITADRDDLAPSESTRDSASPRTRVGTGPSDPSVARIARRVRLLVPHASGDLRAELVEIRDALEALVGPGADVVPLASRR